MSFDDADRRPSSMPTVNVPRRRSPMMIASIVVVVVVVLAVITANIWTEYTWYQQVGYTDVWSTQWITRLLLFFGFGGFAAFAIWGSL